MNNAFSLILKYLFPFTSWFLGVYIALFVMCFYAHVNESNIIANRANALITEITHNKSSLVKVSSVQSMVRKTKPSFLEPSTIVNSLFGKREPFKIINKMLYISGQISVDKDGNLIKGKLGKDMSIEEGKRAAKLCAINIISQVKKACNGDLEKVANCIKLTGYVNSSENFVDQPKVINGASELISSAFGDLGKHTRAAVSANSLPLGVAVEVDAIFELK